MPRDQLSSEEAVLNGIAYDSARDRLFGMGKLWPKIFEIALVGAPGKATPAKPARRMAK